MCAINAWSVFKQRSLHLRVVHRTTCSPESDQHIPFFYASSLSRKPGLPWQGVCAATTAMTLFTRWSGGLQCGMFTPEVCYVDTSNEGRSSSQRFRLQ